MRKKTDKEQSQNRNCIFSLCVSNFQSIVEALCILFGYSVVKFGKYFTKTTNNKSSFA